MLPRVGTRGCGGRSGAGTSATRCRGTARASTGEFARREAFVRWPVHGNVLEALRDGPARDRRARRCSSRTSGSPRPAPRASGSAAGRFLNIGVMVAAVELVEIGEPLHVRQRLLRHRRQPPLRRPRPAGRRGRASPRKGPTRIGDNVWCGANVVVTSGVTIGERCVIGANSVVTRDIPPSRSRRGIPARVIAADRLPRPGQHMTIRWNGRSSCVRRCRRSRCARPRR